MGDYYVILGSEIAIGTESTLKKLYPNCETFLLPADYYERKYIIVDGALTIDVEGEKAEKIAALDAQYDADKAEIVKYFNEAQLAEDAELQAELRAEMTEIDAQYVEDRKAIEEEGAE